MLIIAPKNYILLLSNPLKEYDYTFIMRAKSETKSSLNKSNNSKSVVAHSKYRTIPNHYSAIKFLG